MKERKIVVRHAHGGPGYVAYWEDEGQERQGWGRNPECAVEDLIHDVLDRDEWACS